MGTPCYMAPEQAEGHSSRVGPAADIYALGSILYDLLVGRPPFKAKNPLDTMRQVIQQEPVPPRQLEPRVPHDLETICLKCIQKDPARRFATAGELAADLRRYLDGHPIRSRPTPAWERAWKWAKRRPAIMALIGVCTLAFAGMVLFIAWHNVSLRVRLAAALNQERLTRGREQAAIEARRLAMVRQESQGLYDGGRVAVAARDWPQARLQLEKALATIGEESALESLKTSAETLLKQVRRELGAEAARAGRPRAVPAIRRAAQRGPIPRHAIHRHGPVAQPQGRSRVGPAGPRDLRGPQRARRPACSRRRARRRPAGGGPRRLLPAPAGPRRDRSPVGGRQEARREGRVPAPGARRPGSRPQDRDALPRLPPAAGALPEDARQCRRGRAGRAGRRPGAAGQCPRPFPDGR